MRKSRFTESQIVGILKQGEWFTGSRCSAPPSSVHCQFPDSHSRAVEFGTDPDRIAPADRIIHTAVASSLRIVDERLNELLPAIEENRVRWPPGE